VGTFRISAFRQKGSPAVVVRYIPATIPPLDTLGLPPVLKDIIVEKRGLILMVGATGSGKSTTLAAMLDFRNGQKTGHIFTLEDPVEFIFQNKKSIVNQREVGTDTLDMRVGLKNALRQAPDCILIGEVRDRENMTASIQYAQSGHLCLATLHANNSYHAMNRIISFYPLETRPALLQDLSSTLKCVISQRLVKNVRGTQSAAVEIMLNSRYMAELIEKGEISEMKEAMEKALTPGSQTFEQSLFKMIRDGLITQDEALSNADSANNLLWLINNTAAGADFAAGKDRNPEARPAALTGSAPFSEFKLDTSETERA
jgi:twitching motility protein PilU